MELPKGWKIVRIETTVVLEMKHEASFQMGSKHLAWVKGIGSTLREAYEDLMKNYEGGRKKYKPEIDEEKPEDWCECYGCATMRKKCAKEPP